MPWESESDTLKAAMTETLSVRLDPKVTKRLGVLAKRSKSSKSALAAQAIASYVEAEEWQLAEIKEGLKDLDAGRTVSQSRVSAWLRSWGSADELKPPR